MLPRQVRGREQTGEQSSVLKGWTKVFSNGSYVAGEVQRSWAYGVLPTELLHGRADYHVRRELGWQ